ncbi:hypothetical protein SDC9_03877 [bioreactor metagenome]|uniref:SGNH hydrolase-type esterase domain-containing protein n=1 Tax=bioreactor metagenome TaxID=1076179 RepID=A0A644SUN6_9ZZZZ|nr:hypothetical protein [Negativicutes bacterium]
MSNFSILLVGACTITGFHTAPTAALPILIKRAFRNNSAVDLSITSNTSCVHNQDLRAMYAVLEAELELKQYDIVILQFFNMNLLKIANETDAGKWDKRLFKYLRSIVKRAPEEFGKKLYTRFSGRFIESDYKGKLCKCVELVHRHNQNSYVLLMTPIAPTSKKTWFASQVFYQHYQLMYEIANYYSIDVVDFYTPLLSFSPCEVYQEDGTHLTDKGQKIVGEAIVGKLAEIIN